MLKNNKNQLEQIKLGLDAEAQRAENIKKQNAESAKKIQEQIKLAQSKQRQPQGEVKKSEKVVIELEFDKSNELKFEEKDKKKHSSLQVSSIHDNEKALQDTEVNQKSLNPDEAQNLDGTEDEESDGNILNMSSENKHKATL